MAEVQTVDNNEDFHAHFADEIAKRLECDLSLVADVAIRLLDGHFPASIHQPFITLQPSTCADG